MTVFKIRISGSNDYISKIDPFDSRSFPPGSADDVPGFDHPDALEFATHDMAQAGADTVEEIEGYHCCVEEGA